MTFGEERPCISCGQPTENLTEAYGRGKIWIHPECISTETTEYQEQEAEQGEDQEVLFDEDKETGEEA